MSASADRKRVAPSPRRMAACGCVVALGVIVSALQFAELRSREVAALEIETGLAFARIEETLEVRLRHEIRALERMARRLEVAPPGERAAWEQDAWGLIRAFEHIQAIEWVDTGLIVRWVIPYAGNEAAQDLDLSFEGRRRSALVAARDGRRTVVSRTVDLVRGGRGFLVYVPIYRDDRFAGTVLGVYRTEPLFASILAGTSARYEVSIMDGGTRLHGPSAEQLTSVVRQRGQVSIGNLVLDVEVKPSRATVAATLTWFPLAVGGFGVAISLAVALIFWLSGVSRQQAQLERASSARLRGEEARREQAERSDRESSERLARVMSSIPDYLWTGRTTSTTCWSASWATPSLHSTRGAAKRRSERASMGS